MSRPSGILPGENVFQLPPPAFEARATLEVSVGTGCAGRTGTGVAIGRGEVWATGSVPAPVAFDADAGINSRSASDRSETRSAKSDSICSCVRTYTAKRAKHSCFYTGIGVESYRSWDRTCGPNFTSSNRHAGTRSARAAGSNRYFQRGSSLERGRWQLENIFTGQNAAWPAHRNWRSARRR